MYSKFRTRLRLKCILAFLLIVFCASENSFAFSKEKSDKVSLNSSDNKKLDKAAKELQRSKDAMKEADKIYEEIATKQADLTSEESEKLNNKALAKQIEALKIQQSSNKMKFEVYAAKADEFWKNYKGNPEDLAYAKSLESGARISFQSSEEQYKDAEKGEDKLLVYSSMTSASDLSNKAVDDIKKAFDIYSNTSFEGATVQENNVQAISAPAVDSTQKQVTSSDDITSPPKDTGIKAPNIYQAVEVNENMIDQFNKFMQDKYPQDYEKYIVDFSSLDYSDVNALKEAWNNYIYGNTGNPEITSVEGDSIKADSVLTANLANGDTSRSGSGMNLAEDSKGTNFKSVEKENKDAENVKGSKTKKWKIKRSATDYSQDDSSFTANSSELSNKYSRYEGVSGFQYRVQVVASRVPISNEGLRLIYDGSEQPEENYEKEWYKYSIGPFSTFAQARQFRIDCGVKGAFVVAFLNGKKINPNQELVLSKQNSNSFTNFNNEADLVYKVQVAACRNEMPTDELKKIYENAEQLENSFEDDWHKYLIDCGNDYSQACTLLKNLRIAGAFIAVYRDGIRISLK